MSSEVISVAGPKTSSMRGPIRELTTSLTMTAISIGGTLPRLLTSRPSGTSPHVADSLSTIRSTICPTDSNSITAAPGSPWIPRPSSASCSPMRLCGRCPGMVQVESETPSECTRAAASAAAAFTVSRSQPASARWPAILCTKRVPAIPRGLGASGSATSSETITISTL